MNFLCLPFNWLGHSAAGFLIKGLRITGHVFTMNFNEIVFFKQLEIYTWVFLSPAYVAH